MITLSPGNLLCVRARNRHPEKITIWKTTVYEGSNGALGQLDEGEIVVYLDEAPRKEACVLTRLGVGFVDVFQLGEI